MRKLKLLLAACALFGVTATVWADDDYTDRITNANLASKDGWTLSTTGGAWSDIQGSDPSFVIEAYAGWGSLEMTAYTMKQDVTLPSGKYRAEGYAFYRYGLKADTDPSKSYARFVAGDFSAPVVTLGGITLDETLTAYPNSTGEASAAFTKGYYKSQVEFAIESESSISFGYEGTHVLKQSWFIAGPIKLYRTGDFDYSLYQAQLESLVSDAKALQGKTMATSISSTLDGVVTKYDGKTCSSVADYNTAYGELNAAIGDATNSINVFAEAKEILDAANGYDEAGQASYAADATISAIQSAYSNGTLAELTNEQKTAAKAALVTACKAQTQPKDGCDMTAYIVNPDFNSGKTTGWTINTPYGGNCTIQGGSRMEYWAGNSSNRALASFNISQELTDLPQGVYTVSADMYNSLNGEGGDYTVFSPTCGVYGLSSNEEVALVTEEGDVLKTYTTGEILVFKGKMTIGTKNTVTPIAARWFLFDNVKLTYARQLTPEEIAANIEPESVSLDPSSVNLSIYETATLVPTVLPENANDKSVSWSSADPTIATVDANGVVTAVGFGSTTITATANGADGVSGAATVTVTDATPVDAPAFYSELAAGDFYIVNAATGKFLGGSNGWGTQASLIEHGIPFTVAMNDDKYTLDSHTYESNVKHFFDGTYVDAVSTNLYIVSVGDGKYSISTGENSNFVTAKPGTTVVDNSAANSGSVLSHWYFISKGDRDKMLASASTSSPADATYYIKEANFNRNWGTTGKNVSAWTGDHTKGGLNENMNAMVQNAAADVYQTIENIPNGTYTARVQAVSSGTAKFYANDIEADIETKDDVTSQTIASQAFGGGFFWTTLNVTVTDRTLKIGVKSDDTDKVLYFDNFELLMTDYTPISSLNAEIDKTEIPVAETATITATVAPESASFNKVSFESSDEEVATVDANGVVSAIAVGTATITVTDELKENTKTIDVTVVEAGDYPETEYATESYANDGATRNIVTLSDNNIIKNGAFEYPNTFYGWKAGNDADMSEDGFDVITEDGNTYIKSKKGEGGSNSTAIKTVWPIESGETYVFGYKIKGNQGKTSWTATSLTNTIGEETKMIEREFNLTGDWQEKRYMFTNDEGYSYLQFFARWYDAAFDDFYLAKVVSSTTEGNVDYALEAAPTANIGDGPFQYKQVDIDAAISGLVQGTSTVEEVQTAYDAIKALAINAPADGQLFNVVLTFGGWTYDQKAMTYLAGDRADMGGYNIKYNAPANENLAQAFTFTKVEGNNYKMSQIDADGNVRYMTTGVPYGGNTSQIRTSTNAEDAMLVTVIPTATEGVWNLKNTEANNFIGSQDAGVYTVNSHIDFNIVETTKPSIAINTTAYGTTMLPFAVAELPSGVKAYTCAAIDGTTLTLEEVTTLAANKPYIIEGAWNETVTGDAQGTTLDYTEGLLTGVYAETAAPVESYVLQSQNDVTGFYKVAQDKQPNVPANHAYLTAPSEARVLYFDNATAIRAIETLTSGEAEIYNAAGARQNGLQKGVNIIKQGNKTFKVMVK